MADIYSRQVSFGGAFVADAAMINFGDIGIGKLVQNFNINYAQNLTRLYDLTDTAAVYYVAGRTQGSLALGRVLGPAQISSEFYSKYGNVCNAEDNDIEFSMAAGLCENANASTSRLTTKYVVLNNIAASSDAGSMIINEQVAGMFGSLERGDGTVGGVI